MEVPCAHLIAASHDEHATSARLTHLALITRLRR